jgi:hypothetical protein
MYIIGICLLALLLSLLIFTVSHRQSRQNLLEGFGLIDTWRTTPEFKEWIAFHQEICQFWNKVLDDTLAVEQNGDPTVTKTSLIKRFQITDNEGRSFIKCPANPLTLQSSKQDILSVLSTDPKPYQDTLAFLNKKIPGIIEDLKKSLTGIPPVPTEGFLSYTGSYACADVSGVVTCDSDTATFTVNMNSPENAMNNKPIPSPDDAIIMSRLKAIVAIIPTMKDQLDKARSDVAYLETFQQKAKDGTWTKEVNIQSSPLSDSSTLAI